MSKPLNPTPLILDNSLRGQLKMDPKNTLTAHTHTHTELHEMKATPSFHFRSVL